MPHSLRLFILLLVLGGTVFASAWGIAQAPTSTAPATSPTTAPALDTAMRLYDKLVVRGGPIVWFQIGVSVIGLAFALERVINLRRGLIVPTDLADRADALWRAGRSDEIILMCDREPSTLARMIKAIVEHRTDRPADVAAIASEIGKPELKLHLQKAYPVITVATLEPMLGLFGTVWGMMGAFDTVAVAGELGNPSLLAADIGVALVTTAVGLMVAIPMLALYHFFKSRTHTYAIELEAIAGQLIKNWIRTPRPPFEARS